MDRAIISTAQWVVGKALAPVTDGVLEAWEASKNLGLNIEALKAELLLVQATLEIASQKKLPGGAMEKLLQKLRDSAHNAEDLLDELDYFRIHDELHGTFDAANEHAKGGVHNLILNACHTVKAVGKPLALSTSLSSPSTGDPREKDARQRTSYPAWPCTRKRARGSSSSTPNANQADEDVSGCMRKLGKPLPCSSFTPVHDDGDDSGKSTLCGTNTKAPQKDQHVEQTPKLEFNRVDISERMKHIIEQIQPMRREVCTMLQSCGDNNVLGIAQSRPITTDRSIEPKLYGRDLMMNSIIHDITKGKYCGNDLTVLPIVGPGGIGKTTMIQHIYNKIKVQNHFEVMIWVCVSVNFNLNKILEEMKTHIPQVEGEKEGRAEELIEQRLKSKRFLLVLDDIWVFSNEDDWKRLLLPLKTSGQKGSMILVTTRFQPIARKVKTTNDSIELQGLESEEFRKLFLAFVFGNEQCRNDYIFLLDSGYKIMEKLKGNPLAAKTVGRLLRNDLSLRHWRKVLESKEWEKQTGNNDIMPALKLSYDYLPFQQQQCFAYSALFPEDYRFSSSELINLWIGLDLLQPGGRSQIFDDIGLSNLNNLVTRGFFREDKDYRGPCYVMHDLLHDLALRVASHECLSLHRSNVRSVEIRPCIRHVSVIIDDVGDDHAVSDEEFKSELRNLKNKLKVEHLQTLMLFGKMDESFANILGDLFREVNALRVLCLPNMTCPVESILHKFSALFHLRYLCLGAGYRQMHLPHTISRFYLLRIMDLSSWNGCKDLPKDMSNLVNLCHFNATLDDQHSEISDVGKLKHLQELKVFRVNKKSEGFELKQLEHLTELRELGIYNLEKIQTKEESAEAKLIEKNHLERLTLDWDWDWDWDSDRSNSESVLESLQPHRDLQVLRIGGHKGPSCPTWLGDELAVEALQSLHLVGVSWEVLPSLGKMWELGELWLEGIATMKEFVTEQSFCRLVSLTLVGLASFEKWVPTQDTDLFPLLKVLVIRDCPKLLGFPFSNHIVCPTEQEWKINWFPKLEELKIDNCPEFLVTPIPWTETLSSVEISQVKLLEMLVYSKSSPGVELEIIGKDDLPSFDQVLVFSNLTMLEELKIDKCPPLMLKHLVTLTSLKTLMVSNSDGAFGPLRSQAGVEWQLPVERINIRNCGVSGKELTELLAHLPRLSKLGVRECGKITTPSTSASEVEEEDDGAMLFPAHLSNSLRELEIYDCPKLVLVDPPTLLPDGDGHNKKTGGGGGGLQDLRSLESLTIWGSPKFLSACLFSSPSRRVFPSSLKYLRLWYLESMRTLEPLSNLTSLTHLEIRGCGEDLRCEGLQPLLTTGGQLSRLRVMDSPRFFAGWDPRRVLHDGEGGGGGEQQLLPHPPSSSTLRHLDTNDAAGFLAAHICSFLSSSLTDLRLWGIQEMECFTKEQEDALHLLASLQYLSLIGFKNLQHLPAGLHKLTNLKSLGVWWCPAVSSLPEDGLPNSLQRLYVSSCGNEELKQKCRELVGTIPEIVVD